MVKASSVQISNPLYGTPIYNMLCLETSFSTNDGIFA